MQQSTPAAAETVIRGGITNDGRPFWLAGEALLLTPNPLVAELAAGELARTHASGRGVVMVNSAWPVGYDTGPWGLDPVEPGAEWTPPSQRLYRRYDLA
jgi:hypothetical protein